MPRSLQRGEYCTVMLAAARFAEAALRVMILLARCHITVDDFDSGLPLARETVNRLSQARGSNDADLAAAYFSSHLPNIRLAGLTKLSA